MITMALAKGRLAQKAGEILAKCGVETSAIYEDTRKLILYSEDKEFAFMPVKPADVPTYVEYGIADIGVVGKDTLIEEGRDLYEMVDLKFGKCKLCVAGYEKDRDRLNNSNIKVATKYPNTAKKVFSAKGTDIEIIKLYGSIELAPIVGLSDVIFDIVESGKTLKENGLVVLEEDFDISARLVVNKVSLKTKADVILPLIEKIKEVVG